MLEVVHPHTDVDKGGHRGRMGVGILDLEIDGDVVVDCIDDRHNTFLVV